MGLVRFGFSNHNNQEILSVSDEIFEKKAERRRESIYVSVARLDSFCFFSFIR